jgi:hypothetical protein
MQAQSKAKQSERERKKERNINRTGQDKQNSTRTSNAKKDIQIRFPPDFPFFYLTFFPSGS